VAALTIACTNFQIFANTSAAAFLIFSFIFFVLICMALMQILAFSKSELQTVVIIHYHISMYINPVD